MVKKLERVLELVSAYLQAIAFNALFSIGGLVATMLLFALTGEETMDNWAAYAVLSWLLYATSSTITGTKFLDR